MTGRTLKFGDSVSGSILEILEKSHGFSVNIFYIFKAVGSVDFDIKSVILMIFMP